ncbi:partner of Y14 and mago [Neltuma alba]|uniref:partner of Y14 and mago n=1 Tax=Neltuma alba TaxID=207710 RepID=UPI0010A5875E|nr:partner of Y14 and mago [Prosopis alba]
MATSNGGDDQQKQLAELSKTLKEGERILAPSRRPDGTLRKPIRIRAGYVPQDEVAIYQSKGALLKKELASHAGPPGYDPSLDAKPKSKSVKRNERKKEKRLQTALEKEKNLEQTGDDDNSNQEELSVNNSGHISESVTSLTSHLNELAVSRDSSIVTPALETAEGSDPAGSQDIDKRIRALKKKIRLTEALQQKSAEQDLKPEQLEKLSKLEDWRKELKLLEDQKADTTAS